MRHSKVTKSCLSSIILLLVLTLITQGCLTKSKGGSDSSGSTQPAESFNVSAQLIDEDGRPLSGVTVVGGPKSDTHLSDHEGKVSNIKVPVAEGDNYLYVLSDEHEVQVIKIDESGDVGQIEVANTGSGANCPIIEGISAEKDVAGAKIRVEAIITGDVDDVRAEILYTGLGDKMTESGDDQYSAEIELIAPNVNDIERAFVILVFAINYDEENCDCASTAFTYVEGNSGDGDFSLSSLDGKWTGQAKFRRVDTPFAAYNGGTGIFEFNNGAGSGSMTDPDIDMLKNGIIPPFNDKEVNNIQITLLDAELGLYYVEFAIIADDMTSDIVMLGRLDSAEDPQHFAGIHRAEHTFSSGEIVSVGGRFHFLKGEQLWQIDDMRGSWTFTENLEESMTGAEVPAPYKPRFQYNETFEISDSGIISNGNTTLGTIITTGDFMSFDSAMGKYEGTATYPDGATIYYYFVMGMGKNNIVGVMRIITSDGHIIVGRCKGHKMEILDWFVASELESTYTGDINISSGPSAGTKLTITLEVDQNGTIVSGSVESTLTNISGNIYFTNLESGQLAGHMSGNEGSLTIAPVGMRNASMGLFKSAIVGDFEINTSEAQGTGTFILHKTHCDSLSERE